MIIRSNILPPIGIAGAFWPFIFIRKNKEIKTTVNHESIHIQQQKELLLIGFIFLYILFLIKNEYWNNPFEMEAYANEKNKKYLSTREAFAWVKYIK